ncbi:MAG: alpha/beta hydrolase [Proteobacteria bacterium]|nr:alpha/beta hydrolase [Pseudomonadota bacterium]
MTEPRLHHVQCLSALGLHRMAYWEWGDAANPRVLVCVHGLARQGRDFDVLAQALQQHYRVVCPDVVGRGRSDWLADAAGYQIPAYVADMVTLLGRLNAQTLHWVGTSMGGLIGLTLAALPQSPIEKLVLNDVGPTIEAEALRRIGTYLGAPLRWASVDEAMAYLHEISLTFGPHTPAQWRALSEPMIVAAGGSNGQGDGEGEGGFRLHYDPAIAVPFRAITPELAALGEAALWRSYDALRCPTLVLRGADSDLLTRTTADAMTRRGPKAELHEFAGVGHAPMLVQPDQVEAVRRFLLSP